MEYKLYKSKKKTYIIILIKIYNNIDNNIYNNIDKNE